MTENENTKSIINVEDLCLWYGNHQALENVNLKIDSKSITALILS